MKSGGEPVVVTVDDVDDIVNTPIMEEPPKR